MQAPAPAGRHVTRHLAESPGFVILEIHLTGSIPGFFHCFLRSQASWCERWLAHLLLFLLSCLAQAPYCFSPPHMACRCTFPAFQGCLMRWLGSCLVGSARSFPEGDCCSSVVVMPPDTIDIRHQQQNWQEFRFNGRLLGSLMEGPDRSSPYPADAIIEF